MDLAQLHLHWGQSSYKGNTYRSYYLARPYRKDSKNCKEIVVRLGKLTLEQANRWRHFLAAIKSKNTFLASLETLVVSGHFAYLDIAVANAIWDTLDLDKVFSDHGQNKIDAATIARILTINRCIDPATKSQTPEWFRSTALPWLLDIDPEPVNASRIFRDLDVLEAHKEKICQHLFDSLRKNDPVSLSSVFYDLSSTTFSGSHCALMKWGHCKEGYHNHVVLALVVNREGFPFYWEVLRGGTTDAKTITWLLERLKERFKINGTTVVFDRGMVSDDNLDLLEEEKIKYISAMDKSQLEGITALDFMAFSHLEPERVAEQAALLPGFAKLGDSTYYREVKVDGERRYILCFNPQLFKDQRKARAQAIEDYRAYVADQNAELLEAKKSRQRKSTKEKLRRRLDKANLAELVGFVLRMKHVKRQAASGAERTVRTYYATVQVNETQKLFAGRLDGFWLLVTNHTEKEGNVFTMPAPEAIMPYREKVVIEAAFRDIKSFVEVAPVYVWTDAHVKAHYTICVLAHLINRTIARRLHENPGHVTSDIVSHEKLYAKLSGCMIDRIEVENLSLSTYNMTRPTDEQRELVRRVGLEGLLSGDIVKKARVSL